MAVVVRLMGSVGLEIDGERVDVGGPKPQSVLSVLALSAGRPVSTDRIIDLVWDDRAPVTARRTLQSYTASLRRSMGADPPLRPIRKGYLLAIRRRDVDLLAFEDAVASLLADRSTDWDAHASALAKALSHWEAPFDGARTPLRLRGLVAPFEELHLQAIEALARSQIRGSQPGEAVRNLSALVREHPTRENLWMLLAKGLARIGRRDAALDAIQQARDELRTQLGVDPSPRLLNYERELLIEGVELDDPPASPPQSHTTVIGAGSKIWTGNLPHPVSSVLGRDDDANRLAALVRRSRLVTLCGLGGIGKTTLALVVAGQIAPHFRDGCWFIDIRRSVPAIALWETFRESLGLVPQTQHDTQDDLLAQMRALNALLVIDNCEGRIEEVSGVVERVLLTAPEVTVLATSRVGLGVVGEVVWQVDPLDESSAVELFAERAQPSRRSFGMTDDNRLSVERICRKLDGIPLAIELAASRLSVLSVEKVLEHLDGRFELLTRRSASGSHDDRPLYSILGWTYDLLSPEDSSLLRRLSVFPGSFDLDAVQGVGIDGEDVLRIVDSLHRLMTAGLLYVDGSSGNRQYRLLETVRSYVRSRQGPAEQLQVGRRHLIYCLVLADRFANECRQRGDRALLDGDRHLGDFRTALTWAFAHDEPELGLVLARRLGYYFSSRLLNRERMRWLHSGLVQVGEPSDDTLYALGELLVLAAGDGDQLARWASAQVEKLLPDVREPLLRARLLSSWAVFVVEWDPTRARHLLAEATSLARQEAPLEAVAYIANRHSLAFITADADLVDELCGELENLDGPLVQGLLAKLAITSDAFEGRWERVISETLKLDRASERVQYFALFERAEALGALERFDEAIEALDQHDVLEAQHGIERGRSWALQARAAVELRRGRSASAREMLELAAASWSIRPGPDGDCAHSPLVVHVQLASLLGICLAQQGEEEAATIFLGHAEHAAGVLGVHLRTSYASLAQAAREHCRATLGPGMFETFVMKGCQSTWAELRQASASPTDH